mmetsp:Transcript_14959/g.37932  ORF Transcript_14959/g.37932 Transcript_14959/m.37932 type:complete len:218 (+) Transcript_14959:769-1422(+)
MFEPHDIGSDGLHLCFARVSLRADDHGGDGRHHLHLVDLALKVHGHLRQEVLGAMVAVGADPGLFRLSQGNPFALVSPLVVASSDVDDESADGPDVAAQVERLLRVSLVELNEHLGLEQLVRHHDHKILALPSTSTRQRSTLLSVAPAPLALALALARVLLRGLSERLLLRRLSEHQVPVIVVVVVVVVLVVAIDIDEGHSGLLVVSLLPLLPRPRI